MIDHLKNGIGPLIGGMIFGVGLGFAQMLDPSVIISFLNVLGDWNPSLLFVMGGAVIVSTSFFPLISKKSKPIFSEKFHIPTRRDLDKKLIFGAVIFGIGWAVSGLCPGPGIASLSTFHEYIFIYVVSMSIGMALSKKAQKFF